MDRLTYRVGSGAVNLYEIDKVQPDVFLISAARQKAFNRLAAYEDTGLEPEEITQIKEWWRQVPPYIKDQVKKICAGETPQPPKEAK